MLSASLLASLKASTFKIPQGSSHSRPDSGSTFMTKPSVHAHSPNRTTSRPKRPRERMIGNRVPLVDQWRESLAGNVEPTARRRCTPSSRRYRKEGVLRPQIATRMYALSSKEKHALTKPLLRSERVYAQGVLLQQDADGGLRFIEGGARLWVTITRKDHERSSGCHVVDLEEPRRDRRAVEGPEFPSSFALAVPKVMDVPRDGQHEGTGRVPFEERSHDRFPDRSSKRK